MILNALFPHPEWNWNCIFFMAELFNKEFQMEEIISFLLESPYGQYVLAFCLLCRVFVTVAPASLTQKIPDWIMMIVSALALASNKRVDNKGNPM